MAYTNSSLVSYTKLSPNHSGQRVIRCMRCRWEHVRISLALRR